MILIADSGSTKTDWRLLLPGGDIRQARTGGFNPFYQSGDDLNKELIDNLVPLVDVKVTAVHFYGAGCSTSANKQKVLLVLKELFPKAEVHVEHDLLAAARALCGRSAGIASILGTGSNSCYYDGDKIVENVPSLGFLLGDEGSGSYLGKQLLKDALAGKLPELAQQQFSNRYPGGRDAILTELYSSTTPARYLAGFTKFIQHHIKEPYFDSLVYDSFAQFIRGTIKSYKQHREVSCHFTGSVAFYFNSILRRALQDEGITPGTIIESPIAGLTLYHQEQT